MTTEDLKAKGFVSWSKFNSVRKAELLLRLPRKFGVYVIRANKPVKRARGESDIVYFGSACNQNGLRGRINQYFSPGPTQPTNKRIIALVGESDDYEIGWFQVPAKSDAVALEQRLLERYIADHGERPPQNLKG